MSPFPEASLAAARRVIEAAKARGLRIATAESCTGGLVIACLTEIAGASAVVDRGFVTYDNDAKTGMLGVAPETLAAHGAVSTEVAGAMVEGALARARADLAVAITGVAGPGGGTPAKPVGLVHFAAGRGDGRLDRFHTIYGGDRAAVRRASLDQALAMLEALIDKAPPAAG